jgi:CheY-like chemotaxis protein
LTIEIFVREGVVPLANKRVLVVEDEPILLLDLQEMVTELGGQTVSCPGGLGEALHMAREASVDAAILDVHLRGERCDSVADLLADRDIPFVFVSGRADGVPPRHATRPILQKPYGAAELRSVLVACLAKTCPLP